MPYGWTFEPWMIIDSTAQADDYKTHQKGSTYRYLKKPDQQANCLAICIYFRILKLII